MAKKTDNETIDVLQREQQLVDLKTVLGMKEGRRFVWRILGDAGVFRPSFVAGASDITAFNEGSRNFGLALLVEIMAEFPASFLTMQKEAVDYEQRHKKVDKTIDRDGDTHD